MRPDSIIEAHQFDALGTSCGLYSVDRPRACLLEGELWVRRLGERLTRFSPSSELSRLNAHPGEWMEIDCDLESILRAALRAYEASGGLVNVAVLESMQAIGYTRPLAEGTGAATMDDARPLPPLPDVLHVRRGSAMVSPGSGIDLGGVAKGWMADRLSEQLGANAVANIGGDLRAVGVGPRGDGWPVGMAGQTLMLCDQGAATSSVRRRRWGDVHHLIDPRTGLPASSGLEEVSVIAATGLDAEIVAKTALLLGPALAPSYCAAQAMAWWLGGAA